MEPLVYRVLFQTPCGVTDARWQRFENLDRQITGTFTLAANRTTQV